MVHRKQTHFTVRGAIPYTESRGPAEFYRDDDSATVCQPCPDLLHVPPHIDLGVRVAAYDHLSCLDYDKITARTTLRPDGVAVLLNGQITQIGSADQVREQPVSADVAAFCSQDDSQARRFSVADQSGRKASGST